VDAYLQNFISKIFLTFCVTYLFENFGFAKHSWEDLSGTFSHKNVEIILTKNDFLTPLRNFVKTYLRKVCKICTLNLCPHIRLVWKGLVGTNIIAYLSRNIRGVSDHNFGWLVIFKCTKYSQLLNSNSEPSH
jgi:hypothetical protein